MAQDLVRKKLVVKLPQATAVVKLPCGERKGCISIVVVAVDPPPGAKTERKLAHIVLTGARAHTAH